MTELQGVIGGVGTLIALITAVVVKLRKGVEKRLDKAYDRMDNISNALEEMTMRALRAEAKLEALNVPNQSTNSES